MKFIKTLPNFDSNKKQIFWIGAISFEERCLSSLEFIADRKLQLSKVILLEYSTQINYVETGEGQRLMNKEKLIEISKQLSSKESCAINLDAYGFKAFQNILFEQIKAIPVTQSTVIIDVTCLTKIHSLAVAAVLTQHEIDCEIIIAYSRPLNYPSLAEWRKNFGGWKDIIIAPITEIASMKNQSDARGVLLIGHEAHRLVFALSEIEPVAGQIILADTPGRPDIRRVSEHRNRKTRKSLLRQPNNAWSENVLNVSDVAQMQFLLEKEMERAKESKAPLFLYPFGPKSFVMAAGITLAHQYPEGSWFVYPIPVNYDPEYTEGQGEILWFRFQRS
jgi:hypothetical protein